MVAILSKIIGIAHFASGSGHGFTDDEYNDEYTTFDCCCLDYCVVLVLENSK